MSLAAGPRMDIVEISMLGFHCRVKIPCNLKSPGSISCAPPATAAVPGFLADMQSPFSRRPVRAGHLRLIASSSVSCSRKSPAVHVVLSTSLAQLQEHSVICETEPDPLQADWHMRWWPASTSLRPCALATNVTLQVIPNEIRPAAKLVPGGRVRRSCCGAGGGWVTV